MGFLLGGLIVAAAACSPLPDVPTPRADGGTINPGDGGPGGVTIVTPTPMQRVYVEDAPLKLQAMVNGVRSIAVVAGGRTLYSGMVSGALIDVELVGLGDLYPATATAPMPVTIEVQITDNAGRMSARSVPLTLATRYKWSVQSGGGEVKGIVALPDGGVAVAGARGTVRVINADGTVRCTQSVAADGLVSGMALTGDGQRVVVGGASAMRGVLVSNCMQAWAVTMDGQQWAADPVVNGNLVYATTFRGIVHQIDATTGAVNWRADIPMLLGESPETIEATTPTNVGPEGEIYQAIKRQVSGALVRINPGGSLAWRAETVVLESGTTVNNGFAVATGRGRVVAHSTGNGVEMWRADVQGTTMSAMRCQPSMLADNTFAVCDVTGRVYAVDATGIKREYANMMGTGGIGHGGITQDSMGRIYIGDNVSTMFVLRPVQTGFELVWAFGINYRGCTVNPGAGEYCKVAIPVRPTIGPMGTVFVGTLETEEVFAYAID